MRRAGLATAGFLIGGLAWLASSFLLAQPQETPPSRLGAAEILAAGIRNNGLAGAHEPWHLKARYEIIGSIGSPKESGTYEEFWKSGREYRRTYKSTTFNQTDVATGTGLYRSGDADWPNQREAAVRRLLFQPVPTDLDREDAALEKVTRAFGSTKLPCVALKHKMNVRVVAIGQPIFWEHYCVDAERPILRFASLGAGHDDTLFNDLISFQGQYVAQDIQLTNEKERMTVRVELLENLREVNDAEFTPPAGAIGPLGAGGAITVKSNALTVLKRPPPMLPEEARRKGIRGIVNMEVHIGRDGLVKSIHALQGPEELQEWAVKTVGQWRFRRFLILDEPVEVTTNIAIGYGGH